MPSTLNSPGLVLIILFVMLQSSSVSMVGAQTVGVQREILMELYNATGGPSWYNNNRWGTGGNYCTWINVSCSGPTVVRVDLVANNLVGTIPESLGRLEYLAVLFLTYNRLYGTIPMSLTNHSVLVTLQLGSNALTGTLPEMWGPPMGDLWIGDNDLNGTLPSAWGSLTKLAALNIRNASFSGTLPDAWGNLSSIIFLFISENLLSGTLPSSWGRLRTLEVLSLGDNQLSGTLPSSWSALGRQRSLKLSPNQLSGTLPASWGALTNLTELQLQSNAFTGTLPPEWSAMTRLETLYLQSNLLSGTLPYVWGTSMSALQYVSLSSNSLQGTLQPEWGSLRLTMLDLRSNEQLSSTIPNSWSAVFSNSNNGGIMTVCRTQICGSAAQLPGLLPVGFLCPAPNVTLDYNNPLAVLHGGSVNDTAPCTSSSGAVTTPTPPRAPNATSRPQSPQSATTLTTTAARATTSTAVVASLVATVASPGGFGVSAPSLALMQRSLYASRLRARCADQLDGDTDSDSDTDVFGSAIADNPTQLEISSLSGYAGGAVIGNLLLVIAIGVLLHGEAALLRPWLLRAAPAVDKRQERRGRSVLRIHEAVAELLSVDALPGSGVSAYSLLLQPTVCAAVVLCAGGAAGLVVFGVVAIVACVAPVTWWCAQVLWIWRPFPWNAHRARSSMKSKDKRSNNTHFLMRAIERCLGDIDYWSWRTTMRKATRDERKAMEARWAALFTPYRGGYHWFLVAEWGITIAAGIVSGAALSSHDACSAAEWGGWLLVALTMVQLALHAALRPMNTLLDLVVTIALDAVSVAGQIAAVLGSDATADVATAIGSTLSLAMTVAICVVRAVSSICVLRGEAPLSYLQRGLGDAIDNHPTAASADERRIPSSRPNVNAAVVDVTKGNAMDWQRFVHFGPNARMKSLHQLVRAICGDGRRTSVIMDNKEPKTNLTT